MAVIVLPTFYAVLPAMLILIYRVLDTLLMTMGLTRNRFMDGVIMGKFTGQIPSREGIYSNQPSDENVVAFQLITKANQYVTTNNFTESHSNLHHDHSPLGIFSPAGREIANLARDMYKKLAQDPDKYGCEIPIFARIY